MKKKTFLLIWFCMMFCFLPTAHAADTEKGRELDAVASRLIKDGFDKEQIQKLFALDTVKFTTRGVSTFFSYFESAPSYHQFLKKNEVKKAVQYASDYEQVLDQAEQRFGVDKTVITAILLVETRLGTYLGAHNTLSVLSTIASLEDQVLREKIWNTIPKKARPKRKAFLDKINARVPWGYKELKAFITYTLREGIPPETVKGSFAGAIGICQFMPSNVLALARDGNNDGKIDLFSHEDAIFSVANYLKKNGWKPGLSRQQQYDLIYTYNHSNYYVDTIQKLSDKLKEK